MRATPIDNLEGGRVKQARDIMKHFQTKARRSRPLDEE